VPSVPGLLQSFPDSFLSVKIAAKWTEGGWVVLISFSILILAANLVLISPVGYREPKQI